MDIALLQKYNTPGPRYTSYPTVPYWDAQSFTNEDWERSLKEAFILYDRGLSIYIHLPYCESLCTYCGCNTRITKNHNVEEKYIKALVKEWKMYLALFDDQPTIREIHLGGGTPTFFSANNLRWLIEEITSHAKISESADFAFEAHPNNTTAEQMRILRELGFNRISFGIQDFDPMVQKLINRRQSFQQVMEVVEIARGLGYNSINFDLIYGLPGQNEQTVEETIRKSIQLEPDRIAFYSYAHIPKLKPSQRSYESHLPDQTLKQKLYELGKEKLTEHGYQDIGMDHFAKKSDALYQAFKSGQMHRNFMGYTLQRTKLLIGLGASSIGDVWSAFSQNEKKVETYLDLVMNDHLPIAKGHILSSKDLILRRKILDLICKYQTEWTDKEWGTIATSIDHELLAMQEADGLVERTTHSVRITESGKPFVRNICMAFDAYLGETQETAVFSKTI